MESIKLKMYDILAELNKVNDDGGMLQIGECDDYKFSYRVVDREGKEETEVRFELAANAGLEIAIIVTGLGIIKDIQVSNDITFGIPRCLGLRDLVYMDVLNDITLTALMVEFIKLLTSSEKFQDWWEDMRPDDALGLLQTREQNLKRLTDARMAITDALHVYNNDSKFVEVTTAYDSILSRVKTLSDMSNNLVFKSEHDNGIYFDVGAFSVSILRVGNALAVYMGADSDFGLTDIAVHNLLVMDRESMQDMLMRSLNDAVSEYFDNTDYAIVHPDRLDVDVALDLIMKVIYGEVK